MTSRPRVDRRNLPLLRAQLAAEPDNIFNWCHLYRTLLGLDRPGEAERALEQAVALARRDSGYEGAVAWAELVRLRRERGDDVGQLVAEGRARWPDESGALICHRGEGRGAGGRSVTDRADRLEEVSLALRCLPAW